MYWIKQTAMLNSMRLILYKAVRENPLSSVWAPWLQYCKIIYSPYEYFLSTLQMVTLQDMVYLQYFLHFIRHLESPEVPLLWAHNSTCCTYFLHWLSIG
jgi:hypothetical protein